MFVVAVRPALSRFVERIVRRLGNFVHPKLGDQPRQANASRPAKLTIKINQPQLSPEDGKRLMEAERINKTSEWNQLGVLTSPRAHQ